MGQIKFITDFDDQFYFNKKIFVRVDFNVKVQDNVVSEDYRIRSAIPTIEYLVKRGAKVILGSHLDRPKGKDHRYSLKNSFLKFCNRFALFAIKSKYNSFFKINTHQFS